MVSLRPFCHSDWQVITKHQYPNISQTEAVQLIDQFNTPIYEGKFHKFLAIEQEGQIAGYVSLIEQSEGVVSIGVEVYEPFRRQGCAYDGISQLFILAKSYGYPTATGQVRKDNTASLELCNKLGFTVVNESVSRRGRPVYNLVKSL